MVGLGRKEMPMCNPTEHHFEHGGEGADGWEAWLFCTKCGAVMMVPTDASQPATIFPSLTSKGE